MNYSETITNLLGLRFLVMPVEPIFIVSGDVWTWVKHLTIYKIDLVWKIVLSFVDDIGMLLVHEA